MRCFVDTFFQERGGDRFLLSGPLTWNAYSASAWDTIEGQVGSLVSGYGDLVVSPCEGLAAVHKRSGLILRVLTMV